MRRALAFAFVLSGAALAAWPALTACGIKGECGAICISTFEATAHLPGTAAALFGGSVALCRNGACGSAIIDAASDAGAVGQMPLGGAPFSAEMQVQDEDDGFTMVEVSLDVASLALKNGDKYSLTVTDSHGATLLGVSRPVDYDVVMSCGPTCDDYSMDVYPTSASGIACGDKMCPVPTGVVMTATLSTSDTADPVSISLCRNAACGTGTADFSTIAGGAGDQLQGNVSGGVAAGYFIVAKGDQAFHLEIDARDDAAALADGDMWAVTITQGASTLLKDQAPVTYETTFPNGTKCDAVPCRNATVALQ